MKKSLIFLTILMLALLVACGGGTDPVAPSTNGTAPQPASSNDTATQPAPSNDTATQPAPSNDTATQPAPSNDTATQPAPSNDTAAQPEPAGDTANAPAPSDTGTQVSDPTEDTQIVVDVTGAPSATVDNTDVYYLLQTMFLEDQNKCLEGGDGVGGAAFMDGCQNVTGQLWKFIPNGDGYYKLQTMFQEGENKCFEGNRLSPASVFEGGAFMDACQDVTGQLWKLVESEVPGYYRLQTAFLEGENKCLEGNRFAPESVLAGRSFMDTCQNVTGQLWKLVPTDTAVSTEGTGGQTGCYWQSTDPNAGWVPTAEIGLADTTIDQCYALDSCNGGLGESGGGCYKWADGPDGDPYPWPAEGQAGCYWLSNVTNEWVPTTEIGLVDTSIEQCFALDSCNGGLGQSGGGCYKWTTDPDGDPYPWPNEDVLSGTGAVEIISGDGNQAAGGTTVQLLEDTSVLFLFDASGSMGREKVGNTPRIDIAKETLTNLVNNALPDEVSVAFRAFGLQGQAGVCDTKLIMPLGPLDRNALTTTINGIQPINGETAIADSLAEARNDLAGATGPRQIILLTDGEETCGGDPLAEIQALQNEGFDVQVNIVGFAIEDAALKQQFETWAEAGYGQYFDATNADELAQAVAEALSVRYLVFDYQDNLVHVGAVDDPAFELPAGIYTVVFYPGFQEQEVAIVNGQTSVITIQR